MNTLSVCQVMSQIHQSFDESMLASVREALPTWRLYHLCAGPRPGDASARETYTTLPIPSPGRDRFSRRSRRYEWLLRMRYCLKACASHGASQVLFLSFETLSAASLLSVIGPRGPRICLYVHNNLQRAINGSIERLVFRLLLYRADRLKRVLLLFPERAMVERASELFPRYRDLFRYVPHPVSGSGGHVAAEPRGITILGSARAEKGLGVLESVAAQVNRLHPNVLQDQPIRVVGRGVSALVPSAPGIQIEDRPLDDTEYEIAIKESRWVLVPYGEQYAYRTSGILYDALGCGRPVIVSRQPVFESVLSEASGRIGYTFGSASDAAEVIGEVSSLSQDRWSEFADSVRAYASQRQHQVVESLRGLVG